jgi:uracil-DNA glycosylase
LNDLLPKNVHPSWKKFLSKERLAQIADIRSKIGENFNPDSTNVLRFLQLDLGAIRCAVLGLDPYPEKNRATGRAFEVGDLEDWNDTFRQASLRNIVRLLYKNYTGITEYSKIPTCNTIREQINKGLFKIAQPNSLFKGWERQGVLLLNTYLTTEIGINTANSHRDIWEDFSYDLLRFITKENNIIIWFLWGNEAQKNLSLIPDGYYYACRHPSRVSEFYNNDFLKCNCFKDTMGLINWLCN